MKAQRRRIDWDDVRHRLEQSQQALDRALTLTPERLEAVYQERARQLASRRRSQSRSDRGERVLVFTLAEERFAVAFADLVELLPFTGCTPVPAAPPHLLGVANVHGEIRSVIDLGRLLTSDTPGDSPTTGYLLRVRIQGMETAFRVESVEGIRELETDRVVPPPDGVEAVGPYLRGVMPDRLRILDTVAVLAAVMPGGIATDRG